MSKRHWERLPTISARPTEHYIFEDLGEVYDIAKAAAAIRRNPTNYIFRIVPVGDGNTGFGAQVLARGNIDMNHVSSLPIKAPETGMEMKPSEDIPPLLIGMNQNQQARLLDGYHRAYRLIQLGYACAYAWILTPSQTDEIRDSSRLNWPWKQ